MQCPRCLTDLKQGMARNGVLVDYCPACRGAWLDRGEIYLFSDDPARLQQRLAGGLQGATRGQLPCPRCHSSLDTGRLRDSAIELEQCPHCEGLWFDPQELKQVLALEKKEWSLEMGEPAARETQGTAADGKSGGEPPLQKPHVEEKDRRLEQRIREIALGATPLPNLYLRSASVLILLFGILGAVLIACVEFAGLPPLAAVGIGAAVLVLQYALGPFIMDLSLRFLYRFSWLQPDQLPHHLRAFVQRVMEEEGRKFPSFGLIHDGAPNAFTYGHHPGNMRIVISQGVLDLLEQDEVEAVVAHEIGHGKHWDMALMTLAQLVPLILYYVYRTLIRMRTRGRDKSAGARIAIAVSAYVLYLVSEYIVLWFSRTREYHADRYAGEITGSPNSLASALVKIGYGLAAEDKGDAGQEDAGERRPARLGAIGALGIFDGAAARGLVVASSAGPDGAAPQRGVNKANLMSAMQWDLWNPWAKYYELHSTHPLIANRLRYLSEQSAAMGREPYIVFDRRRPESYWDDFAADLCALAAPLAGFLLGGGAGLAIWGPQLPVLGAAIALMGLGSLYKTWYSYRGGFFAPLSVAALLHKVKVSGVRPVPAEVEGVIIGRGVPGLVYSEDFVLRDRSGILFLDYRQPLRLWDFFFGLLRAGQFEGQAVKVTGWYRRAPIPYLEIGTLEAGGRVRRCYTRHAKYFWAALLTAGGLALSVASLAGAFA